MRSLYGRKIYDAVPGKLEYGTPYIFWQLLEAVLTARLSILAGKNRHLFYIPVTCCFDRVFTWILMIMTVVIDGL